MLRVYRAILFHLTTVTLAFFVTTVSFVVNAHAEAPMACLNIFFSPNTNSQPIESLLTPQDKPYVDSYGRFDHAKNFWKYHNRFGVIRNTFGQLVLIAKHEAQAQELLSDLSAYSQKSITEAKRVRAPGFFFQKGVAFDVTNLLPEMVAERLELSGKSSGPNCINACLVLSQKTESLIYSSDKEIKNWLTPPFAKQITDVRDLMPGDVLIFKGVTEIASRIEHAAIYISPRLVLTKNGMHASKSLRLMDIDELSGMYLHLSPEDQKNLSSSYQRKVSAYRLLSVDDVLAKKGIVLPDIFIEAQNEIDSLAQEVSLFHQSGGNIKKLRIKLDAIQLKWRSVIYKEEEKVEHSEMNIDRQDLWLTLWKSLSIKLKSIEDSLRSAQED